MDTAFRFYRAVRQALELVIDIYRNVDADLRVEFATDADRTKLLDEAIYELDSEGNVGRLGQSHWGQALEAQEQYALVLDRKCVV